MHRSTGRFEYTLSAVPPTSLCPRNEPIHPGSDIKKGRGGRHDPMHFETAAGLRRRLPATSGGHRGDAIFVLLEFEIADLTFQCLHAGHQLPHRGM